MRVSGILWENALASLDLLSHTRSRMNVKLCDYSSNRALYVTIGTFGGFHIPSRQHRVKSRHFCYWILISYWSDPPLHLKRVVDEQLRPGIDSNYSLEEGEIEEGWQVSSLPSNLNLSGSCRLFPFRNPHTLLMVMRADSGYSLEEKEIEEAQLVRVKVPSAH